MTGAAKASINAFERLLDRDRRVVAFSLIALVLLTWIYLVVLATELAEGDMRLMGMSAIPAMGDMAAGGAMMMPPQTWTSLTFALMLLMWWIMMIGMMVPSAAPMILLFVRIERKNRPGRDPWVRSSAFTLGYVLAWFGFSLAATVLQWGLGEALLLSPMMVATSPLFVAAVLALAGLYQLTPLKQACLKHCRSPLQFLSTRWQSGHRGALVMGLEHGTYCVGCCWFLMALLFVGGVMNLLWIAAIAVFVLAEKVMPHGPWFGRISGLALMGSAGLELFEFLTVT